MFSEWSRLSARPRLIFLIGLALVTAVGAAGALAPSLGAKKFVDSLHWTLAFAIAAAIVWSDSDDTRTAFERTQYRLLGMALTGYALGQIVWDAQAAIGWAPFPAPSDVGYLCLGFGLCIVLARELLRGFTGFLRLAVTFDVIALATIGVATALLIYAPHRGQCTGLQMAVTVAYAFGLLTATALALVTVWHWRLRAQWRWISFIAALVCTDELWLRWNYLTLTGGLRNGTLYNFAFSFVDLWLAISLVAWRQVIAESGDIKRMPDVLSHSVPMVMSGATVFAGFILVRDNALSAFQHDIVVIAAAIIILAEVSSQQMLVRERGRLVKDLMQTQGDLERAVVALEMRNHDYARALAATEAANRSKSMFLANMSHELRTPLNAVIGFSEIMGMHEQDLPERFHRYPENIVEAGRHLLRIVEDVLAISQTELDAIDAAITDVPVYLVVQSALLALRPAMQRKTITLDLSVPEDLSAAADPRLLQQALIHLISNAVKFTPKNGRIAISAELAGAAVRMLIVDTGPGIDDEHLATIFEPFEKTLPVLSSLQGGIGIGLSLSRRFIELQEGTLTLRRASTGGTEAEILMPRAGAAIDRDGIPQEAN